jgi:hypothetical protein
MILKVFVTIHPYYLSLLFTNSPEGQAEKKQIFSQVFKIAVPLSRVPSHGAKKHLSVSWKIDTSNVYFIPKTTHSKPPEKPVIKAVPEILKNMLYFYV